MIEAIRLTVLRRQRITPSQFLKGRGLDINEFGSPTTPSSHIPKVHQRKISTPMRSFSLLVCLCLLVLAMLAPLQFGTAVMPVFAADDKPDAESKSLEEELPRIPATEPKDALKTFTLQHGFKLEMVAHEPDVMDPVDACFDERGRMFVAEMRGYPYSPEPRQQCPEGIGKPEAGVIRMLEDADQDGFYEKSIVYADKIAWPTSVCCFNGGIFVTAAPYLHYFKDTDGDGVADIRENVFAGFSRNNVQGLVNNLKWGLDNHIHFAAGPNGGNLNHRDKESYKLASSQLARFNPVTEKLEMSSGGSQFGHAFDNWGHRFVCSNSNHIQQTVFEDRYLVRNPYLPVPGVLRSISKEGGASPVFRLSPAEPWRLVRTRRRANDPELSKRLPPTELVPIGFFTSATGVTPYRGSAYPEEFQGNVFIGDVGGNLVHRKTLQPNGASFLAVRADEGTEFLASTDNWFRPTNFVNAPDGTLYILDMYRETIEHPYSIPADIKAHLDLESGHDRGRVYRLVSPGMQKLPGLRKFAVKDLGKLSAKELVAELESPNSWNRETAQRLLWERQDKSAVEALEELVKTSKLPEGRLHALWTLEGLKALTAETLIVGLADEHPRVREHVVKLSEKRLADSPELAAAVIARADDDAYDVRLQLAFTLGELDSPAAAEGLVKLAKRDAADADIRTAWLTSVLGKEGILAYQLLTDEDFVKQRGALALIAQIAGVAGARDDVLAAGTFLSAISRPGDLPLSARQSILQALGEGLGRRGVTIAKLLESEEIADVTKASVAALFKQAATVAEDDSQPLADRQAALATLAYAPDAQAVGVLQEFLTPQAATALQISAVRALAMLSSEKVGPMLLANWSTLTPALRKEVVEAVLPQPARLQLLLAAIESGKIKSGELERDKKELLLNHPNMAVRELARKLLKAETSEDRAKVLADYQAVLSLTGSAEKGQEIYKKNCSVCHRAGTLGKEVGPNLATTRNKTPADLLINILDPNREALPAYVSYTVVTDQAKILTGMIASESATSITLRRAEAAEDTVLRNNIDEMVSSGVSLMPVGLEKDITPQQMADLIEFVRSIEPEKEGAK